MSINNNIYPSKAMSKRPFTRSYGKSSNPIIIEEDPLDEYHMVNMSAYEISSSESSDDKTLTTEELSYDEVWNDEDYQPPRKRRKLNDEKEEELETFVQEQMQEDPEDIQVNIESFTANWEDRLALHNAAREAAQRAEKNFEGIDFINLDETTDSLPNVPIKK